jgi:hypothetical protein
LARSLKDSTEYSGCVLAVADSTFRVVSIDLDKIGELSVLLPWSLDYPSPGVHTHLVSWELFGMNGLN